MPFNAAECRFFLLQGVIEPSIVCLKTEGHGTSKYLFAMHLFLVFYLKVNSLINTPHEEMTLTVL